ncbi:hypothetical protein [Actinokineospora bangkokensis]|uniref:PE domain-containing protein n=1 Tax=Actinokineospora bangkokensis TaxID=1193682 RepID=A0A1Q9LQY8_9PSEU|nr:hypothetical protein [Actinokineospora bangkokensis]OLR94432.1 hypothetical protein BJP25_11790 [Actinokineospora bangkokensis]
MTGFHIDPDAVTARLRHLLELADSVATHAEAAAELAQSHPLLGTSPPATRLSDRLVEAAGDAGLAGEAAAAESEVRDFRKALSDTLTDYERCEFDNRRRMRS